jgi:hypothetical protein
MSWLTGWFPSWSAMTWGMGRNAPTDVKTIVKMMNSNPKAIVHITEDELVIRIKNLKKVPPQELPKNYEPRNPLAAELNNVFRRRMLKNQDTDAALPSEVKEIEHEKRRIDPCVVRETVQTDEGPMAVKVTLKVPSDESREEK